MLVSGCAVVAIIHLRQPDLITRILLMSMSFSWYPVTIDDTETVMISNNHYVVSWYGRSGNRIPVGARFSVTVRNDLGTHSASCTTVSRSSFQGKSVRSVALTTHSQLGRWLRREYSYTSTPLLDQQGQFQDTNYLTFCLIRHTRWC
jgi:hypothetical protein